MKLEILTMVLIFVIRGGNVDRNRRPRVYVAHIYIYMLCRREGTVCDRGAVFDDGTGR